MPRPLESRSSAESPESIILPAVWRNAFQQVLDLITDNDVRVTRSAIQRVELAIQIKEQDGQYDVYQPIADLCDVIPEERRQALITAFDTFTGGERTYVLYHVLQEFIQLKNIKLTSMLLKHPQLQSWLGRYCFLRKFFQTAYFKEFETLIQYDQGDNAFQLATLLSFVKYDELSEESKQSLAAEPVSMEADLQPFLPKWWLCSQAEYKCINSGKYQHWTMAEQMYVKGYGRLSGLALRTMVTPNGIVFLKGVFYAAVSDQLRHDLRMALACRSPRASCPRGTWLPMRAATEVMYGRDYMSVQDIIDTIAERVTDADSDLPLGKPYTYEYQRDVNEEPHTA